MADTLDLLTLTEAKSALNISVADWDTEIASFVTAVSRRLDDECGPVVFRVVTDELHDGGSDALFLRYAPASATAGTTISTVTEYSSGVALALTAEGLTSSTSNDFYFDAKRGILHRRSGWRSTRFGAQRVVVTYSAGRYASTATVDPKFKQAAAIMLAQLWRREQGGGTETFGAFSPEAPIPTFAVPNSVLELLKDEVQGPNI